MVSPKRLSTLIAYPVQKEFSLEKGNELKLTQQEADVLRRGEVLLKAIDINGEKTQQYLQLDPETKSVIHRRTTEVEIERKLKDMEKVNDIELGTQQKQQVREGKPMELNVGGEKVTVGIDLKEPQGFKVVQGDMKEWERQQKIKYDEQHPEFIGLVMTDKNRWEYQKVVDSQSAERAIKIHPDKKEERSGGLKLSSFRIMAKKKDDSQDALLIRQFDEMKTKHPDAILLFRRNDSYEIYRQDAQKAKDILGLDMESRKIGGVNTDVVSFKEHSLDIYLPKLVRAGMRVAICEQLEDPKQKKVEKDSKETLSKSTDMPRKKRPRPPLPNSSPPSISATN